VGAMDDFIMTIEDDTEIKTYNEEENEENDNSPTHKENKDSRKRKKKEKKASINEDISLKKKDINPDFSFSFGDDNFYNDVEGWDFVAARAGLKPKLTIPSRTIDEIITNKRNEARSSLILNTKTNGRNNSKKKNADSFGAGTQCDIYNDENESSENDEGETDEDDDDQMSSSTDEYWNNHEDRDNDSNSENSSEDEDEKQRKKEYFADESELIHYDNAESFQTMNLSRPILKGL
ncbi:17396_t:CDS:2, partial [Racocetra persica]